MVASLIIIHSDLVLTTVERISFSICVRRVYSCCPYAICTYAFSSHFFFALSLFLSMSLHLCAVVGDASRSIVSIFHIYNNYPSVFFSFLSKLLLRRVRYINIDAQRSTCYLKYMNGYEYCYKQCYTKVSEKFQQNVTEYFLVAKSDTYSIILFSST